MKKVLLTAVAVAPWHVATGVATAAQPSKTDAQILGNVQIDPTDPTVGYVTAHYVCQPGSATHLWVSVKQTADRSPDNALKGEGSSAISAAWSQNHPTAQVVCDGKKHTDTFTVSHDEYGFGSLAKGQGYVQFCLFGGDGTFTQASGSPRSSRQTIRRLGPEPGAGAAVEHPAGSGPNARRPRSGGSVFPHASP